MRIQYTLASAVAASIAGLYSITTAILMVPHVSEYLGLLTAACQYYYDVMIYVVLSPEQL